jgi:hypothetical protein
MAARLRNKAAGNVTNAEMAAVGENERNTVKLLIINYIGICGNHRVGPHIFGHFVDLLADPSKIFIYYSSGGQDCVIACVTKDQLAELNRQGAPFEPLQ